MLESGRVHYVVASSMVGKWTLKAEKIKGVQITDIPVSYDKYYLMFNKDKFGKAHRDQFNSFLKSFNKKNNIKKHFAKILDQVIKKGTSN